MFRVFVETLRLRIRLRRDCRGTKSHVRCRENENRALPGRSPITPGLTPPTMPDQNTDAEAKLRKLGQRLRQAWAKQHPITERSLDTVKNAIREQWEKEQAATRGRAAAPPGPAKGRERKPE